MRFVEAVCIRRGKAVSVIQLINSYGSAGSGPSVSHGGLLVKRRARNWYSGKSNSFPAKGRNTILLYYSSNYFLFKSQHCLMLIRNSDWASLNRILTSIAQWGFLKPLHYFSYHHVKQIPFSPLSYGCLTESTERWSLSFCSWQYQPVITFKSEVTVSKTILPNNIEEDIL